MYDNLRDAEFRLRRTVVFYDGSYRYVNSVERQQGKYGVNLTDVGFVPLDNDKLKIRSIPTGYVIAGGVLCYLQRNPTRTYRQGLRADNTKAGGLGFDAFARSVMLGDVKTVGKDLAGNKILNKDYAVRGNKLFYREREVGVYVDGKPYLHNGKSFLKELLDEVLGGKV